MEAIKVPHDRLALDTGPKDETLMSRVVAGDASAADALVQRYQHTLFSFLYRLTLNTADTEDLFQETWLRLLRYRNTFRIGSKFSTWLFQIAVNCTRDLLSHKMPAVPVKDDMAVSAADITDQPLENRDNVAAIVEHLPLPQREVLVLKYFHDMKETEIAALLEIPLGTVKSRLHNAMACVRRFYEQQEA